MIAVLDDDIDDLELIDRAFKKSGIIGYKTFLDSKEFLKSVGRETIVIVIDHNLSSGITGFDIMKKAIKTNPLCYAIIVSGQDDPQVILNYMNNDAFRYVVKRGADYVKEVILYVKQAQDRINRIANYIKEHE